MSALSLCSMLVALTVGAAQDTPGPVAGVRVTSTAIVSTQTTVERGRLVPRPIVVRRVVYRWSCARPFAGARTIACVIEGNRWKVRYSARDGRGLVSALVRTGT